MKKQVVLAILLLVFSAVLTSAQSSIEQAVKNARDQFSDIKNRSIELERMKRDADKRPVNSDSTPKFPEIKEDFERIQRINSEALQPAVVAPAVNYAAVLKSVSEINHRAVRLKSNLFSAEIKQKKASKNNVQSTAEPQNIENLFGVLDESINSFAHSSIFQNTNLVNSQDSLTAQHDLETIIKISNLIKEKAEKSLKENQKNNDGNRQIN